MPNNIRPVNSSDLALILSWRNDDATRRFMFSQESISLEDHLKWFERNSKQASHKLLIYEESGQPTGFIQLKTKDEVAPIYEWGFYTKPGAVKGTGSRMLRAVISTAFEKLNAYKIYGEVLGFNHASINLHKRLGFKEEGVLRKHFMLNQEYQDVHCFGLLRDEVI